VRTIDRIAPKYLIISADLLADLANQFVALTLLDVLIFKGENALSNLVVLCLVQQTPSILLSPLAGLWMDRVGVRTWLTLVNMGKCALVGLLILQSSPWIILPAYLLFTVGSLFFNIGRLSVTPLLIPKKEIIAFNALNERVSLVGSICGPCVISWVVLKAGQGVALGLAGALLMLSVCAVCGLPKSGDVPDGAGRCAKESGGKASLLFRYREPFRKNHHLRAYFLIFGFVLLGGGVLNIGLPILFKSNFGSNIADWGLILSGFQAGSCLATFLLPRWSSTFRPKSILSLTFLILAGGMALLGHLTTYIQIALLMILFGCGLTLIHIFLESLIQQTSPKVDMGKTISILTAYRGACYLGAILTSALVLSLWGPQPLLLAASLVMLWASLLTRGRSLFKKMSIG
jgi:MFS family permease